MTEKNTRVRRVCCRSISGRWQQCLPLTSAFVVCLLSLKQPCIIGRPKRTEGQGDEGYSVSVLTGILDLDSGVGLRVRLVNHLSADLLCQNLHRRPTAVDESPQQSLKF